MFQQNIFLFISEVLIQSICFLLHSSLGLLCKYKQNIRKVKYIFFFVKAGNSHQEVDFLLEIRCFPACLTSSTLWSPEAAWSFCSCFLASPPLWIRHFFFPASAYSLPNTYRKQMHYHPLTLLEAYSIKVQLNPLVTSKFSLFLSFLTSSASLPFQYNLFIKRIPLHFSDSVLILFLYLAPPISPFPPYLSQEISSLK